MSLKAGAKRSAAGLLFLGCFLVKGLVVGAVGMWESRSDFQGLWEARETWVWFSSLSIARHFHSPPRFNLRAPFVVQAREQLAFGCLHVDGGLSVGLDPGRSGQLIRRHIRAQESGQAGELPQDLPRR